MSLTLLAACLDASSQLWLTLVSHMSLALLAAFLDASSQYQQGNHQVEADEETADSASKPNQGIWAQFQGCVQVQECIHSM